MKEKTLDVLCLQEPYCYKGKVRGYNSPNLVKIEPQDGAYSRVAAVVNKENVETLLNVGNQNEHILCFKVISGESAYIIINVYCQYSAPLEGFLDKVETLINSFPSEKLLITMDANAKSELWHSEVTDDKGMLLEEFVLENSLMVLNRPNTHLHE